MRMFGLLGRTLDYSFSRGYFTDKFERLGLSDCSYRNFELSRIEELPEVLSQNPALRGLNVTIPYKTAVIPYLHDVSDAAREIGAVNTIEFRGSRLIGHNTDVVGFALTLKPFLDHLRQPSADRALVLGDGGAAQAVKYVLAKAGLRYVTFKRKPRPGEGAFSFAMLGKVDWGRPRLIVNTTPVGTFPNVQDMLDLPVDLLSAADVVIDLIYNPAETKLLREASLRGAQTANGLRMLEGQAEASWAIWNGADAKPD